MRISDWISDVCSSDLADFVASSCFVSSRRRHTRCALVTGVQTCALPIWTAGSSAELARDLHSTGSPYPFAVIHSELVGDERAAELGRASCRERVGPSGSLSWCAVASKKKYTQPTKRTIARRIYNNSVRTCDSVGKTTQLRKYSKKN